MIQPEQAEGAGTGSCQPLQTLAPPCRQPVAGVRADDSRARERLVTPRIDDLLTVMAGEQIAGRARARPFGSQTVQHDV